MSSLKDGQQPNVENSIANLKDFLETSCYAYVDSGDVELAIMALEKQLSKPVLHRENGNHECPSCSYQVFKGENYCWSCGQKLSWYL